MNKYTSILDNQNWLEQIFAAISVGNGGVARRKIYEVERKIGRRALELEVRRRGFHLIECGNQFVIIYDKSEVRMIC